LEGSSHLEGSRAALVRLQVALECLKADLVLPIHNSRASADLHSPPCSKPSRARCSINSTPSNHTARLPLSLLRTVLQLLFALSFHFPVSVLSLRIGYSIFPVFVFVAGLVVLYVCGCCFLYVVCWCVVCWFAPSHVDSGMQNVVIPSFIARVLSCTHVVVRVGFVGVPA